MIVLLQGVSDSAAAVAPALTVESVGIRVQHLLGPVVPNQWVMAGITVALLVLLLILIRGSSEFPLRGMVVGLTTLAFVSSGAVLGIQLWDPISRQPPEEQAKAKAAEKDLEQQELEKQPVAALDTYIPAMPGADSAVRHEQPSTNGLPSGTVWDELTNRSIAQIVKYYADDTNHPGWQVEFSAPNGVVLRRTVTAGGQLANERLRILARPNVDPHGKKTEIEFELTRRLK